MKTTILLLIPKIGSIRNSITLKAILKRLPFTLIGLIFYLSFYIGSYNVLNFIRSVVFFGEILSKKLFSMTFFSLGVFMVLSNIITALSSFYISKDIPLLMSKPIKIKEILRLKTIETIFSSSWMAVSFIPPLFIAYGVSYHASLLFYIVFILTFIAFLLMAGGFGITVAHVLTGVFPAKKTRLVILAIGLIVFLFIYLSFRSKWPISPEGPEGFIHTLLSIKTDSPYLPNFWITESVFPLLQMQSPNMFYLFLLFGMSGLMLIISSVIGNKLYIHNLDRVQPSVGYDKKISTERLYPGNSLAFLWKDVKVFFRDTGQWSQLFIISALMLIYVYNFRSIPLRSLSEIFPFVKELMVLINMSMAGLVLTAVSARFLYSSISLEGMAFWVIRSAPVTIKKILWSKFLFGFIPVTIILLTVVFITNIAMGIDYLLMILSGVTIFILCVSISGLGIGMGALYPRFRYENIASISLSPGGMLFMLIAFLIVLLTVSLEAWSFYSYKKAIIIGLELRFMEKVWFVLAGLFVIVLNSLTFYIPMKMGEKRLKEDFII